MSLKILDVDINALRSAAYASRARSPEMVELIGAIQSLRPGDAKALVLEEGETISGLRSKLGYAARVTGVKLRTTTDESRLMFTLKVRSSSVAQDRESAAERRDAVLSTAAKLTQSGQHVVSAEEVLQALAADGMVFETARPATMVGAFLRSAPQFTRVGKNEFKYEA